MKKIFLLFMVLMTVVMPSVSAYLSLDTIYTDPAIISSGDEVDIVIQYENKLVNADEIYNNNPDYTFKVTLSKDDDSTKEFIRLLDSQGDDYGSSIYPGNRYNKIYRIKVQDNAPSGSYQFRLVGEWYYQGEPSGILRDETFYINVKREAINIDVASIKTIPATIRPGDVGVELHSYIQNVGIKNAKSVTLTLELPKGFTPSYADNNRKWLGGLSASETKETTFYFDIAPFVSGGVHKVTYKLTYEDLDDNMYSSLGVLPFFVKEKANLIISQDEIIAKRGDSKIMEFTVTNTGLAAAEHIDVRVLKQSAQLFSFESRSQYIGLLAPGESSSVQFVVNVDRNAPEEGHNFDIIIRSKGDSDQGDTGIYTYNRKATLIVDGSSTSPLVYLGGIIVLLTIIFWIRKTRKNSNKSKNSKNSLESKKSTSMNRVKRL